MTFFKQQGVRMADAKVYDTLVFGEAKEIHKKIVKIIDEYFKNYKKISCLDVGCANGAFLFLLKNVLAELEIDMTGLDIHQRLLDILKSKIDDAKTICASLLDEDVLKERYDLITCLGTFSIFDDFEQPFLNLFNSLKKDGLLIISSEFNNFPIDVIMRYRDVSQEFPNWEKGWNIFSKMSVERFLSTLDVSYEWIDYSMPFERAPNLDDSMRTWTIKTSEQPFQQVNGAQQLVNQSILRVVKRR